MQTTTVEELVREARATSRAEFLRRFPHPFIVLDWLGAGTDDLEQFSTADGSRLSPFARVRPRRLPSARTKVAEAKKRPGANDFPNMVTIGRAGNNDVTLDVSSVSKFHAYITKDSTGQGWVVHDAGSSNGTWVNGEKLGENRGEMPLEDGSAIQIGPDASVRFYTPEGFHALAVQARSDDHEGEP